MDWVFETLEGDEEEIPMYLTHMQDPDSRTEVIRNDEEVVGGLVYKEQDGFNDFKYMEIAPPYRGTTINGESVAETLSKRAEQKMDGKPLRSQAVAMHGKIQHLREKNGFEPSGFYLNNHSEDLVDDIRNQQGVPFGGMDAELWTGVDEKVKVYLPPEIRGFAEASLQEQREVEYVQPYHQPTISLNVLDADGNSARNQVLRTEMEKGDQTPGHLVEELEEIGSVWRYWAHQVDVDPTEPEAYDFSQKLYENGYRPVNFRPDVQGGKLTMADLNIPVGYYRLTPETLRLVEESGINYEEIEADGKSNFVAFYPQNDKTRELPEELPESLRS